VRNRQLTADAARSIVGVTLATVVVAAPDRAAR